MANIITLLSPTETRLVLVTRRDGAAYETGPLGYRPLTTAEAEAVLAGKLAAGWTVEDTQTV